MSNARAYTIDCRDRVRKKSGHTWWVVPDEFFGTRIAAEKRRKEWQQARGGYVFRVVALYPLGRKHKRRSFGQ